MKLIYNIFDNTLLQNAAISCQRNTHRVLYYHLFKKPGITYSYYYNKNIPEISLLRNQLEWLKKLGFIAVSVEDILDDPTKYSKQKTFSLSTDDGYADNFETLVPLLAEEKIPCVFYICNKAIDNNEFLWKDRIMYIQNSSSFDLIKETSYILEKQHYLNNIGNYISLSSWASSWPMEFADQISKSLWSLLSLPDEKKILEEIKPYFSTKQIMDLLSAGYSIGSHTNSHYDLKRLSPGIVFSEVINSFNDLEKRFKTSIKLFSYPYGSRVETVLEKQLIEKTGARIFFGTKNYNDFNSTSFFQGRDRMDFELSKSKFWFSVLPLIRKHIFRPLNIEK